MVASPELLLHSLRPGDGFRAEASPGLPKLGEITESCVAPPPSGFRAAAPRPPAPSGRAAASSMHGRFRERRAAARPPALPGRCALPAAPAVPAARPARTPAAHERPLCRGRQARLPDLRAGAAGAARDRGARRRAHRLHPGRSGVPGGPRGRGRSLARTFVAPRRGDGPDPHPLRGRVRGRTHGGLGPRRMGAGDRPRLPRPRPSRLPAGLRLEERGPRNAGDPGGGVRLTAVRGARRGAPRAGGRARGVLRARLERRVAGGAADPRAGVADAEGHDARPRGAGGRDPAEQRPMHGGEGGDQRGPCRLQARVPAGGPRRRRGGPRTRVRDARPALHHVFLEPDGDRQRPRRSPHRHELRGERARPGQPGEREHRAGVTARRPQRGRRRAGRDRPGHPGVARQVHLVLRGGRIRPRLAAPRPGARDRSRRLGGDPVRGRGPEPEHGRGLAHAGVPLPVRSR